MTDINGEIYFDFTKTNMDLEEAEEYAETIAKMFNYCEIIDEGHYKNCLEMIYANIIDTSINNFITKIREMFNDKEITSKGCGSIITITYNELEGYSRLDANVTVEIKIGLNKSDITIKNHGKKHRVTHENLKTYGFGSYDLEPYYGIKLK